MRDSTQITAIAVLVAMALATTSFAQARSVPEPSAEGPSAAEPPIATFSGPAGAVDTRTPSISMSEPGRRGRVLATLSNIRGTSKSGRVLVIPSTQMKPEDVAAIIEDMTIMSRIFEKRLADEHLILSGYSFWYSRNADPFHRFFSADNRTTEAIYVEGFGSLFLMSVDFPLSPPPQVEAAKPENGTDQVWVTMREDMYRPEDSRRRKKDEQKEQYDAEKIDDLQRTLIKALKHAANIRGLKANESVTIMVRGSDINASLADNESPLAAPYRRMTGELTAVQPTFLTIRAKKSDIDSFAKNDLDYDQLRQRVQTVAY